MFRANDEVYGRIGNIASAHRITYELMRMIDLIVTFESVVNSCGNSVKNRFTSFAIARALGPLLVERAWAAPDWSLGALGGPQVIAMPTPPRIHTQRACKQKHIKSV